MKIEKLNDNQIRCTLFQSDLISRQIKISELASNSGKARELFRDMMTQAKKDFGFEADDMPLMIEAMPGAPDGLVLIITKVDDPSELDNKFSKFSNGMTLNDSDMMDMECINDFSSEFDDTFPPLQQPGDSSPVYRFSSMSQLLKAARALGANFDFKNSLFKTTSNELYLLIYYEHSEHKLFSLSGACNILSEFGALESVLIEEAFFAEHCTCLISDDAVQTLAKI